jgi:hypothetical protein
MSPAPGTVAHTRTEQIVIDIILKLVSRDGRWRMEVLCRLGDGESVGRNVMLVRVRLGAGT